MRAFAQCGLILMTLTFAATPLGSADEPGLGEKLLRQLWNHFKEENISELNKVTARGFQSVHWDGVRDRAQEMILRTS